jgi:hypothetical protein
MDKKSQTNVSLNSNAKDMLISPLQIPQSTELGLFKKMRGESYNDNSHKVVFSPDNTMLASCSSKSINIFSVMTGQFLKSLSCPYSSNAAFSPDSTMIVYMAYKISIRNNNYKSLCLWSLTSDRQIWEFKDNNMPVISSIAFSPDGSMIATGFQDGTVRLWCAISGQPLKVCANNSDRINIVKFSPDSQSIVSTYKSTVRVWSVATGKLFKEFTKSDHEMLSVAFSLDGNLLASSFNDGILHVWSVASEQQLQHIKISSRSVTSAAFSPNCQYIVFGLDHGTVQLCSIASGQQIKEFIHTDRVSNVTFSPDGNMIAFVSGNTVYILKIKTELERLLEIGLNNLSEHIIYMINNVKLKLEEVKQQQDRQNEQNQQTTSMLEKMRKELSSKFHSTLEEVKHQQDLQNEQTSSMLKEMRKELSNQFHSTLEEVKHQQDQQNEQITSMLEELRKELSDTICKRISTIETSIRQEEIKKERAKERQKCCLYYFIFFTTLAFLFVFWPSILALGPNRTQRNWADLASRGRNSSLDEFDSIWTRI